MRHDRSHQSDEFSVALDTIHERIRLASHTDWATHPEPVAADDDAPEARFHALVHEEQAISRRRRELHARIDTLAGAPGPLNDSLAAQLERYRRAEIEVSRTRRRLHREIDELAATLAGPPPSA